MERENGKPAIEPTTLWDFPKQSYGKTPKGNWKFNGVTPAGVIWNMLQRYTKESDIVIDPMCGSGTTIDVCKEEHRKVIGYDIAPTRPDIIQNDARKIPLENDSVDMVFIDSPYGDNVKYSDHPDCIGKISAEKDEFYHELEKVAKEIHRILKKGKVVGWVIGDHWRSNSGFVPVGITIYQMLAKYFEPVDIICLTRKHQRSNTDIWKQRAVQHNFYLRGFKYLFIMRKC
ncbi:MAG: methyltransferase domain-containing protein [Candidatus Aenigmarchaeota archaeon]|nr:methyltransferase domain-containing protein [Candidatus Aenigmarchaeota archaeon]